MRPDENFVAIGNAVCPVCCVKHKSRTLYLHKQLRAIDTDKLPTEIEMCQECEAKLKEGYVALIACSNLPPDSGRLQFQEAERTGEIIWIRTQVWPQLTSSPLPERGFCFTGTAEVELLLKLVRAPEGEQNDDDESGDTGAEAETQEQSAEHSDGQSPGPSPG